ncbi:MAG TPA: indole-3-glycerol phosphate synthase TrpC [Chloroflexi bacterium]|nr:indole-3-glycerol phosphate synthase TrpC [Chloroflexota bacterium]|tara:strand:+ start:305 stop:1102 length:798 start_codon:yes stop_codon:yes gene_type:complete
MTILNDILTRKKEEVQGDRKSMPRKELEKLALAMPPNINFLKAINERKTEIPNLIAEIKHRSPSKGILCQNFNHIKLAQTYVKNDVSAISVLTDQYFFGGSLAHLKSIYELQTGLPLLRKDFIYDEYQLYQAKVAGASAALLIVAMLDEATLANLINVASEINLDVVVEIHNTKELEIALKTETKIIGINNRNLHTFKTSLNTTKQLRPLIPNNICVIAESGIHNNTDVKTLAQLNINAMLIGEGIVTAKDIGSKIQYFINAHEQ